MKKILVSVLSTVMAVQLTTAEASFWDVPSGFWAEPYIETAVASGLMGGTGDSQFSPTKGMSYSEFAVVIVNGAYGGSKSPKETDTHWADPYLNVLLDNGLFLTKNGNMVVDTEPGWQNELVTREDVATVVARLKKITAFATGGQVVISQYSDLEASGSLYESGQVQDILDVIVNGIMVGDKGAFGVGNTMTRAEACVVIETMLERNILFTSMDSRPPMEQTTPSYATVNQYQIKYGIASWGDWNTMAKYATGNNNYSGSSTMQTFSTGNTYTFVDSTDIDLPIQIATFKTGTSNELGSYTVERELDLWGGVYVGEEYNYMVFGQQNYDEEDNFEVYRIVKYDKEFQKIDSLSITGAQCATIVPFSASGCAIEEQDGVLVVHTSRKRYESSDGLNHQSQFTIVIDSETMEVANPASLRLFQDNHVSHSFNQMIDFHGESYALLDHGDAYPRAVVVSEMVEGRYIQTNLLQIPGTVGDNYTGVYLGGFGFHETGYLVTLNRDSFDDNSNSLLRNPVLLAHNKSTGITTEILLSDCISQGLYSIPPYMVDLGSGRYFILWQEFEVNQLENDTVYGVIVDESGEYLMGKTTYQGVSLPANGAPVLSGDRIVWVIRENDNYYCHEILVPNL